ncbi:neuropeptide CCHamide-1 receptor-like [Periplaneta americana]|uniref:neuropeptide CCHamide-1 receptor-like n=1 Tax=Periplaneta americana TaxID=6978 RepID=UPI0037E7F34E
MKKKKKTMFIYRVRPTSAYCRRNIVFVPEPSGPGFDSPLGTSCLGNISSGLFTPSYSLLAASEADNHSSLTTDKKNASEVGNSGEQYTTLDIFTSHVDPVVYSIYIVVGFLLNGAVIIMFIRSEEIRKPANVMILNLAICDILNIGISGPLQFLCSYEPRYPMMIIGCRTEMAVRQLLRAGAALSLVALSIQRFFITMPSFHRYSSKTSNIYLAVYILAIWLLAMLVSLPTVLVMGVYTYLCSLDVQDPYPTKVMVITNFLFYCALLPLLMFVFSFVTARRLRRSVREFRGTVQNQKRNRSANVVIFLSVLFIICFLPYELWCVVVYCITPKFTEDSVGLTLAVSKYFLFANACFNPLALYFCSGTFKTLFRKYYFCCSRCKCVNMK